MISCHDDTIISHFARWSRQALYLCSQNWYEINLVSQV